MDGRRGAPLDVDDKCRSLAKRTRDLSPGFGEIFVILTGGIVNSIEGAKRRRGIPGSIRVPCRRISVEWQTDTGNLLFIKSADTM